VSIPATIQKTCPENHPASTYSIDCIFYSWRRKYGAQIPRKFGPEKTRLAMGHCPMSKIYEKFYDQGLYDLNVIVMLIDGDDRKDKRVTENHNSLSLHRAELVRQCERREKTLDKFVDDHEDVKAAFERGDYQALKGTKKRVRQYALVALLTEDRELQKSPELWKISRPAWPR